MSSEELSDFIYAAEHSISIREDLKSCDNNQMILDVARKYGFSLKLNDLLHDSIAKKTSEWFFKSRINPIKKSH